jgi:hypothetical protein
LKSKVLGWLIVAASIFVCMIFFVRLIDFLAEFSFKTI